MVEENQNSGSLWGVAYRTSWTGTFGSFWVAVMFCISVGFRVIMVYVFVTTPQFAHLFIHFTVCKFYDKTEKELKTKMEVKIKIFTGYN